MDERRGRLESFCVLYVACVHSVLSEFSILILVKSSKTSRHWIRRAFDCAPSSWKLLCPEETTGKTRE